MYFNQKIEKFFNKKLIFFFVIAVLFTILISNYYFSNITYFYGDHLLIEFIHNFSKGKNILDIIVNPYSLHGIPFTPHNPSLNFLAEFNYNLSSRNDYLLYLALLRTLEIFTIFIFIYYFFNKKIDLTNILFVLIVFLLFLNTFSIFDHQSYINLPIIIINLSLGISLFFTKKKLIFFSIHFASNFIAYLMNPMYFFISCFGPLLFFLIFWLHQKQYQIFFISILANLLFAFNFVLLTLGTARFSLGEYLLPVEQHYNFAIFNSQTLQICFLLIIISNLYYFFLKKNFKYQSYFFVLYFFLIFSLILGFIYQSPSFKWLLPSPIYLDYSLQYIYVVFFVIILSSLPNNFKFFVLFIFFILGSLKSINYFKNISQNLNSHNKNYETYNSLEKRNFWDKNNEHFLNPNFKNKKLIIDFPNENTDYSKFILNDKKFDNFFSNKIFNSQFGHSSNEFEYHQNSIITNRGHSLLLDISTLKSSLILKETLHPKERIPKIPVTSKLNNIFDIDFIFSDKKYELDLEKKYDFKKFSLYVYKNPIKNINKNSLKLEIIKNFENYVENVKNFDDTLYLVRNDLDFEKVRICRIKRFVVNKELIFQNQNDYKCIAIFPIPFSNNNNFLKVGTNSKCETFRVQYYFHGCILEKKIEVRLKKNNILFYPFFSLIDFIESKKLNII